MMEFMGVDCCDGSGLAISYDEINSNNDSWETGKIFYS